MTPRFRLMQGLIYGAILLTAAIPLARELLRPKDIWWTPFAMRVPLTQSTDRVEIYVNNRPLLSLLEAGKIQVAENGAATAVAASDVGLRFNNRDRIRSERLPGMLWQAAMCGVLGGHLILLATNGGEFRQERQPRGE